MKTHLTKYAKFLGEDWSTCSPEVYHRPEVDIRETIETHLADTDLSDRSKDNQLKDVLAILRLAVKHGRLKPEDQQLQTWNGKIHTIELRKQRPRVQTRPLEPYALGAQINSVQLQKTRSEWKRRQAERQAQGLEIEPFVKPISPTFEMLAPGLAHEVDAYLAWCTPKVSRDRPHHLYKTEGTRKRTRKHVACVAGYAVQQGHDAMTLTLKMLCDAALLEDFAWWWINERVGRNTQGLSMIIEEMKTIARYSLKDEEIATAIAGIYEGLPAEEVVIDKDLRMLTLEELEWIGLSIYPLNERRMQELPYLSEVVRHVNDPLRYPMLGHGGGPFKRANGRKLALWAEASLIIRLMVRRPLRQINVREMMIDTNLVRVNGGYELRFVGDELKVRQRRVKGRHRQVKANRWVFHFPHELQGLLQEYLDIWRPKLLQSPSLKALRSSPYLLINSRGRPFDTNHMARVLEETTFRFTQNRPGGAVMVNPHQVRTIWATRMLKAGLNIIDVARFLGDRIQTIYDKYVTLADESPPATPWEIELAEKIAQRKD
jgi:integrase